MNGYTHRIVGVTALSVVAFDQQEADTPLYNVGPHHCQFSHSVGIAVWPDKT